MKTARRAARSFISLAALGVLCMIVGIWSDDSALAENLALTGGLLLSVGLLGFLLSIIVGDDL